MRGQDGSGVFPSPGTGIRDVAQGDVGVGTPIYPHEAAGTVLPMQGAGRPGDVGLS